MTDSNLPALLTERIKHYARRGRADNTRRAYRADWSRFTAWCATRGFASLPAEPAAVAAHLAELADSGYGFAAISRATAAIAVAHRAAGIPSPRAHAVVGDVLRGIRRGSAPPDRAPPILIGDLKAMCAVVNDGPRGLRDRAVLLVGWAGALRRSSIVGIDVAHLTYEDRGMIVHLPRSKTDQDGVGRDVAVRAATDPELDAPNAMRAWLKGADIAEGPAFRGFGGRGRPVSAQRLSPEAVNSIVHALAARAGLEDRGFSAHSLRAGYVTEAAKMGLPEWAIARHTGHSSAVLRDYIRIADPFGADAIKSLV